MANRDEVISFLLNVKGAEDLSVVAAALRDAGIAGEEAKPEIAALVAELEELAATNSAASRFASLTTELGEVSIAISDAKLKVDELTMSFGEAGPATAAQARQLANAIIAVGQLTDKEAQLRTELAATTETLAAAGIATDGIAQAQARLGTQAALTAEKLRLVAEAAELTGTAEEKEKVTVEELAEKYAAFGHVLETFKDLAITVGGLIAFEKVKEEIGEIIDTGDKFEKWGIQFANAFGGAEQGAEALEKVKELAEHVPISLDDLVQVAIKAKKEGLDPLNGTLQTLIDVNAKYGGSIDSLNGLVDAFGKAQARGVLNTRLLVTLTQQGVPAARLLGDAMGKTGDQIEEMAKKGELGRDSIQLLLQKLAEGSSGASAKSMGLLSTQVIKLKDDWDEFLKLIADSGVYDFAKEELKQVGEALKTGLGDGTLKEKAQAISDAIVGIGRVAEGTIQFIIDHAGAIKTVAEAYIVLRAAGLAVDLGTMINGFRTSTIAALENQAAIQRNAAAQAELAAAMKAAAVAAEAETVAVGESAVALDAASKGGILAALSSFGSLRGMLNGVGTAIAALAGGPTVALVAAIGYVVYEAINVTSALKDWYDVTQKLDQLQKQNAQTQLDLVAKAKQVADQTKAAADVQIKSAAEVKELSQEQSEAYLQQLQDATRYYTALRIQARDANDPEKVAEYTAKLRELGEAQREVAGDAHDAGDEQQKAAEASTKSVATLTDQISKLHVQGVDAGSAVAGVFENLKIETPEGLNTFLGVLNNVKDLSGGVADALRSKLIAQLQNLNEVQFQDFKRNIAGALNDGKISAEQYQLVIQTIAQSDMLKLGLSAEQVGIKFAEADNKIIASFNDLARNATATAVQIQAAFAKALDEAKTEADVEELENVLKDAFDAGKISADQFSASMQFAKLRIDELAAAAAKDSEALTALGKAASVLGITLQADLARAAEKAKDAFDVIDQGSAQTAAGLADRRAAFLAYAKAALDASAQLDQGTKDSVQYQLESKAASLGLLDALQQLEGQGQKTGNAIAGGMSEAAQATREAEQQTEKYNAAMETLRDTTASLEDRMKALAVAEDSAANSTQKAAAAAEGVQTRMEASAGASVTLAGSMEQVRQQFVGNKYALAEFDQGMKEVAMSSFTLSDYLNGLSSVERRVKQDFGLADDAITDQINLFDKGADAANNYTSAIDVASKTSLRAELNARGQPKDASVAAPAPSPTPAPTPAPAPAGSAASSAPSSGAVVHFGAGAIQLQLQGPTKPLSSMSDQEVEQLGQRVVASIMPNLMHQIVYQFQLAKQRA